MTLNGVITVILRFFIEFDSFAGRLCRSGWRQTYNVRKMLSPSYSIPLLIKTNSLCSAVSLRQLSIWWKFVLSIIHRRMMMKSPMRSRAWAASNNLQLNCAKSQLSTRLVALRVLRSHCLPDLDQSLKDVFQATVIGKIMYCAPAWHGFCSASDYSRLNSFLRRCIQETHQEMR